MRTKTKSFELEKCAKVENFYNFLRYSRRTYQSF